eukprot:2728725-Rhodomonas_salina.2
MAESASQKIDLDFAPLLVHPLSSISKDGSIRHVLLVSGCDGSVHIFSRQTKDRGGGGGKEEEGVKVEAAKTSKSKGKKDDRKEKEGKQGGLLFLSFSVALDLFSARRDRKSEMLALAMPFRATGKRSKEDASKPDAPTLEPTSSPKHSTSAPTQTNSLKQTSSSSSATADTAAATAHGKSVWLVEETRKEELEALWPEVEMLAELGPVWAVDVKYAGNLRLVAAGDMEGHVLLSVGRLSCGGAEMMKKMMR